jgi:hypothetical protein
MRFVLEDGKLDEGSDADARQKPFGHAKSKLPIEYQEDDKTEEPKNQEDQRTVL